MEKDEVSNESCNLWKNTAALKELSMFVYIDCLCTSTVCVHRPEHIKGSNTKRLKQMALFVDQKSGDSERYPRERYAVIGGNTKGSIRSVLFKAFAHLWRREKGRRSSCLTSAPVVSAAVMPEQVYRDLSCCARRCNSFANASLA